MAGQWYCFTDDEQGPMSFVELAALVAQGELNSSDLVRREESQEWQRVDAVPGLLRRAQQQASGTPAQSARSPRPHESPATRRQPKPRTNWSVWWTGQRMLGAAAIIGIVLGVGRLGWFLLSGPEKFPEGRRITLEQETPALLDQMRAPPSRVPTLPDLPTGVPVAVPGFERIPWLKSPSLSDDLKTIVYVTYRGDKTLDDLMIATRTDVSQPFSEHRVIEGTVTEFRESHPTLSPDGLELIYAVNGTPATLFRSRRADGTTEFGPGERLLIEKDPFDGRHHDAPQFVDARTLVFTTYDSEFRQRSLVLARRSIPAIGFVYVETLPVADPWPRYFLSRRLSRAYFPSEKGLFLTARHPGTQEFVTPEPLLSEATLGPGINGFDGTLWMSPAEDLIFYCSPGFDPRLAKDNRLWMMRF